MKEPIKILLVILFIIQLIIPASAQETLWNELVNKTEALTRQGMYSEAVKEAEESLKVAEETFDPYHPAVALSLNNLAFVHKKMGNYNEAEKLYKRSLKIREEILGKDHPDVAQSHNNLAVLYYDQRKYAEAEIHYKQSLEILMKLDHPYRVQSLRNLAFLFEDQGKYAEAEVYYKRSKKISEKWLAQDYPAASTLLGNMESNYEDQGKAVDTEKQTKAKIKPDNEKVEYHERKISYPYSLQVSSCSTLEGAENVINHYNKKGLSLYWFKVNLREKGIWYRIFIGHFEDLEQAEKFRQEHGLTKSIVRNAKYANLIGIYTSSNELEDNILSLKKFGYSPYVIEYPNNKSRIFVGAFPSKEEAEEQYNDLKSHNIQVQVVKR